MSLTAPPAPSTSAPVHSHSPLLLFFSRTHSFSIYFFLYLFWSPSPLTQSIEAVTGVQPVVRVFTHLPPPIARHSLLLLFVPFGLQLSLSAPSCCLTTSSLKETRRPLSPARTLTDWAWGATGSQAEERGSGRRTEKEKGGVGAQWCCYDSSCHQCLTGKPYWRPK